MNVFLRAGLGTLALAALGGGAWHAYDQASTQAIRTVSFSGDTARIAPADLERLAATVMALPPKEATLSAVRDAAKRVAWVSGMIRVTTSLVALTRSRSPTSIPA